MNLTRKQDRDYLESMKLIFMILSFLFLFIGVVGNMAVIICNIYLNHGRTISSWLVTNLAVADLSVCFTIYLKVILRYFRLRGGEYHEVLEKLGYATIHVSLFLSMMMLLAITVDKYLFIAKPLRYPIIVTSRRMKLILCVIWLTAAIQLLSVYIKDEIRQPQRQQGRRKFDNGFRLKSMKPLTLSFTILLLIPVVVITILNYKILKIVQKQRKRIASETVLNPELGLERLDQIQPSQRTEPVEQAESVRTQQEHNIAWLRQLLKQVKAIKTFAIIFGVLIFCFVPYFIVMALKLSGCSSCLSDDRSAHRLQLRVVTEVVGINSIANSFIYALRHRKYIRAYKKLFSTLWERLKK